MAGDSDVDAQIETVADRVEFLELLDENGPLQTRDVVEALDHSRGTVTRALRSLRDADLVEKTEGGYDVTTPGVMAAREYRRYRSTAHAILDAKELLEAISDDAMPPTEVLTGADAISADETVPLRSLEAVSDRVQTAERVRAYLPTLVNPHLLRVWHRAVVANGADATAYFDPDLLTVLKGQYSHLLSEMAASSAFTAHTADGPSYGVLVTEAGDTSTLTLVVYEGEAAVRGVVTNDDPGAVEWGRSVLEGLDATDVTADLELLSAAVTDGVASRPAPEPGAGPMEGSSTGGTSLDNAVPLDLEAEGFVGLSAEFFEKRGLASPAVSWRTGFSLAEVRAGQALDRHTAGGEDLTDDLVEALRNGDDHVLLGLPGSGKSTVCMSVACEWFDRELGPVLYREAGAGDRFESTALLEASLRQADGHCLVVVEEALDADARGVIEVMQALDGDESVTFLLESRTDRWHQEVSGLDGRLDAYRRTAVRERTVPELDRRECERLVSAYADQVDAGPPMSGDELFELVREGGSDAGRGATTGDVLVAQHYLVRGAGAHEEGGPTALEESVRETYDSLASADDRLLADLGVLVGLLAAAGLPVAEEYCYALADPDEFGTVETALDRIEGQLVFEQTDPRAGGPTTYRTVHETVATRFLEGVLDRESESAASERVGRCVSRLLSLADDPDRREAIQRHLGGRTPFLHQVETDPGGWADELAERLFDVGRTDANLAGLFGETGDGRIELPEACSGWTRLQVPYWRGEMYSTAGDLDRAEREFRALGERAESMELPGDGTPPTPEFTAGDNGGDPDTHRTRWRATSHRKLATIYRRRGEYDDAETALREALDQFRSIDDERGAASCLRGLGTVALARDEYDRAREHYEAALDLARETGDRRGEARCLDNLGLVAQKRGDHDRAREHHREALDIKRELGDRRGQATAHNNLGIVAVRENEYDEALEHYEQSLAIHRETGYREGEANGLSNVGNVLLNRGEYDRAREYHEAALEIYRDLGHRAKEAGTLGNLGNAALNAGDNDLAREYYEQSLDIREDLDGAEGTARPRLRLGALARREGDHDAAREYVASALETFEAIEYSEGVAAARLQQCKLALAEDDTELARERGRAALEAFEDLNADHWIGSTRFELGRVAAGADDTDRAREHWRAAVELLESVGAPQDALEALEELVETCREVGDDERALEWVARARELVDEVPEPIAEKHREWVQRHAEELD